jgi:hypothetical protein
MCQVGIKKLRCILPTAENETKCIHRVRGIIYNLNILANLKYIQNCFRLLVRRVGGLRFAESKKLSCKCTFKVTDKLDKVNFCCNELKPKVWTTFKQQPAPVAHLFQTLGKS